MPHIAEIIEAPAFVIPDGFPQGGVTETQTHMTSPPCPKHEADPESTLAFESELEMFNLAGVLVAFKKRK